MLLRGGVYVHACACLFFLLPVVHPAPAGSGVCMSQGSAGWPQFPQSGTPSVTHGMSLWTGLSPWWPAGRPHHRCSTPQVSAAWPHGRCVALLLSMALICICLIASNRAHEFCFPGLFVDVSVHIFCPFLTGLLILILLSVGAFLLYSG